MKRKYKKLKTALVAIIAIVLVFAVVIAVGNTTVTVTRYEVESEKLPAEFSGYKIALITDLHSAEFGKGNSRLISKLCEQEPDIVLLGGDMINSNDTDMSVFYNLCEQLVEKYPTYYIFGNHELIKGEEFCEELEKALSGMGVFCRNNSSVELKKGSSKITLSGLWFNLRYYQSAKAEEQYNFGVANAETLLGKSGEEFNILLTHNPHYFETYSEWGADLTLCGHMHGGMIRLPFVGGVFSPEKDLFPEYDEGVFENNGNKMIVSGGLGNGQVGFRVFNTPEIVIVELKTK